MPNIGRFLSQFARRFVPQPQLEFSMLQINVPRNPTAEDMALALKLLITSCGPAIMSAACENLGMTLGAAPAAESDEEDDAPQGAIPPVVGQPATVPPPVGAAPELDSKGFPWDERINSSNKTKNNDGSWKGKKGVDDATKEAVRAQLRAAGFGTPAPAASVPPPPLAAPVGSVPPPPPTAASVIPIAPATVDFPFLMQQYTALSAGGKKLNMEDLNNAVVNATGGQATNAVTLNQLADKATYFPIVLQYLQQAAAAKA